MGLVCYKGVGALEAKALTGHNSEHNTSGSGVGPCWRGKGELGQKQDVSRGS